MKKLFKYIILGLSSLMVAGLFSCGNLQTIGDAADSSKNAKVKVTVTSSRAADPEITLEDFTEFELKGIEIDDKTFTTTGSQKTFATINGNEEKSAYQVLQESEIIVPCGHWEFTLEAKCQSGLWVSDAVNTRIKRDEENNLSFTLTFNGIEKAEGETASGQKGSAEVSLTLPEGINFIKANLYKVNADGSTGENVAEEKTIPVTEKAGVYTEENLEEGIYKAVFYLYAEKPYTEISSRASEIPATCLGMHTEYLNIIAGHKSTSSETVESLEEFTIQYILNNKLVHIVTDSAPGSYSHFETKDFPKLLVKNDNFVFGGWYTDEACSGEAVTSTEGMAQDIKLYAKWTSAPLTIMTTAESPTLTITNPWTGLYYKIGNTSSPINGNEENVFTTTLPADTEIILYASVTESLDNYGNTDDVYMNINFDQNCYVYGNVMSLLQKDYDKVNKVKENAFRELFKDNTHLINESSSESTWAAREILLPATEVSANCYKDMFNGCTGLTRAPSVLPAETLAMSCYEGMFQKCSALESTPELPAENLASWCYAYMFEECSALKSAPELPADIVLAASYNAMFHNCTSLEEAPDLNAVHLGNNCYANMFSGCTSLTKAPALPAGTKEDEKLANSCYELMFANCSSLVNAPDLPAIYLAYGCYKGMFSGCDMLENVPEVLPATELADDCYREMFSGCSALTKAPLLPAETLTDSCYMEMFYKCNSLNELVCFAENFDNYSMSLWLSQTISGTLKVKYYSNWENISKADSTVPSSWTIVEYTEE
ncbi:MAG: InlB B-repeat-containing protein [Treponema sp.]|nr:InlB B-repeat-containing protein [Treponema sp.]